MLKLPRSSQLLLLQPLVQQLHLVYIRPLSTSSILHHLSPQLKDEKVEKLNNRDKTAAQKQAEHTS